LLLRIKNNPIPHESINIFLSVSEPNIIIIPAAIIVNPEPILVPLWGIIAFINVAEFIDVFHETIRLPFFIVLANEQNCYFTLCLALFEGGGDGVLTGFDEFVLEEPFYVQLEGIK